MDAITAALKVLTDLEAIGQGSAIPVGGWSRHYEREAAARSVVQNLIADERDALEAAKEAAIQANPERLADQKAFAHFFA